MADEKPRIQKVLEQLYQTEGTIRPKEIADKIGETPLKVGQDLHALKQRGYAESESEGQWKITDEGRESVENGDGKETGKERKDKKTTGTVPSQSDLFQSVGENLGLEKKKGGTPLDAIVYYVQRTADLDNLDSVWNALTEMGIAGDVKKRWIKLYAANLPNKELTPELREKLEMDEKKEKVSVEPAAKPKIRLFNVVEGQIYPDEEGAYTFSQALQKVVAERSVSSPAAFDLPQLITALTPLFPKEIPKTDNSQLQTLAQSIETLREELHNQQLTHIQEQNQAVTGQLTDKITRLEQELHNAVQTRQVDSKFGLMSKGLDGILGELGGARRDIKEVLPGLTGRGVQQTARTPEEKAKFDQGIDEAIDRQRKSREMEDALFFGRT